MATRKKKDQSAIPAKRHPFYIISGKDRRRAIDVLHRLVEQLLGDADPQLAMTDYDGKDAVLAEILTDLRTLPFLSEFRLVVVKDADDFISQYRSHLEDYQKEPSETGILILQAETVNKSTRLAKAVIKAGGYIDCSPVDGKSLPGFLVEYARETHDLTLPMTVSRYLIEMVGDESGVLCGEIDKFAAYLADPKSPRKTITQEVVDQLSGHNRQYTVFNVIDCVTGGRTAEALNLLYSMLQTDREAEYGAVGAFAWHIRRLYTARLLLDEGKVREREIPKMAGVWQNQASFMRQVKQMKLAGVIRAIRSLAQIDINQKTGRGTVKTGLENFIVEFSSHFVR